MRNLSTSENDKTQETKKENISIAHIPIKATTDNKLAVTWLHVAVHKWHPEFFLQNQKAWAWTTDAQEGGNPVNVGKLRVQMYGFWDRGNHTTDAIVNNANYVETETKKSGEFPFPEDNSVSATAWCEEPNAGPIRVELN